MNEFDEVFREIIDNKLYLRSRIIIENVEPHVFKAKFNRTNIMPLRETVINIVSRFNNKQYTFA